MRLFKLVLTALFTIVAVLAGLFMGAIAAVVGVALLFFGRSRQKPASAGTAPLPYTPGRRAPKSDDPEIIDVVATEVSAEPAPPPRLG